MQMLHLSVHFCSQPLCHNPPRLKCLHLVALPQIAVLHTNDLNDAVRKSNGSIKLTVVEPSSGRKSDLNLSLK